MFRTSAPRPALSSSLKINSPPKNRIIPLSTPQTLEQPHLRLQVQSEYEEPPRREASPGKRLVNPRAAAFPHDTGPQSEHIRALFRLLGFLPTVDPHFTLLILAAVLLSLLIRCQPALLLPDWLNILDLHIRAVRSEHSFRWYNYQGR
jgi:hypothetical protein